MNKAKICEQYMADAYQIQNLHFGKYSIMLSILVDCILIWVYLISAFFNFSFLSLYLLIASLIYSASMVIYSQNKDEKIYNNVDCLLINDSNIMQYKEYYIINNWRMAHFNINGEIAHFLHINDYTNLKISEAQYQKLKVSYSPIAISGNYDEDLKDKTLEKNTITYVY